MARGFAAQDAKTLSGMNCTASEQGRLWIQRSHTRLGHRRWDDVLQSDVESIAGKETHRMDAAPNRDWWTERDVGLVERVRRERLDQVRLWRQRA